MVFATIEVVKEQAPKIEQDNSGEKDKVIKESTVSETPSVSYSLKGINAGPAVRKYARESEIDLTKITPSGHATK